MAEKDGFTDKLIEIRKSHLSSAKAALQPHQNSQKEDSSHCDEEGEKKMIFAPRTFQT